MNTNTNKVEMIDVRMPFLSMVVFMVKAAMMPIPATIILIFIGTVTFGVLCGLMGGFGGF